MFLSTPLDQPLKKGEIKDLVLQKVEERINASKTVDDALLVIEELTVIRELSGLALAEAYYRIKHKFGVSNDYIFEKVGKSKDTVNRYIRVAAMKNGRTPNDPPMVPESYQDRLFDRNIKDLIPIANALDQGYEIEDEEWEQLTNAPDFSTVSKIVREDIKEKEPRANTLVLYARRNGDVVAFKDGKEKFCGYLLLNDDDIIVQQAVARIIKDSRIMEA